MLPLQAAPRPVESAKQGDRPIDPATDGAQGGESPSFLNEGAMMRLEEGLRAQREQQNKRQLDPDAAPARPAPAGGPQAAGHSWKDVEEVRRTITELSRGGTPDKQVHIVDRPAQAFPSRDTVLQQVSDVAPKGHPGIAGDADHHEPSFGSPGWQDFRPGIDYEAPRGRSGTTRDADRDAPSFGSPGRQAFRPGSEDLVLPGRSGTTRDADREAPSFGSSGRQAFRPGREDLVLPGRSGTTRDADRDAPSFGSSGRQAFRPGREDVVLPGRSGATRDADRDAPSFRSPGRQAPGSENPHRVSPGLQLPDEIARRGSPYWRWLKVDLLLCVLLLIVGVATFGVSLTARRAPTDAASDNRTASVSLDNDQTRQPTTNTVNSPAATPAPPPSPQHPVEAQKPAPAALPPTSPAPPVEMQGPATAALPPTSPVPPIEMLGPAMPALPPPPPAPHNKQPLEGQRPAAAAASQTPAASPGCNIAVCQQFYRSFRRSDCTYQPFSGGPRRICDR